MVVVRLASAMFSDQGQSSPHADFKTALILGRRGQNLGISGRMLLVATAIGCVALSCSSEPSPKGEVKVQFTSGIGLYYVGPEKNEPLLLLWPVPEENSLMGSGRPSGQALKEIHAKRALPVGLGPESHIYAYGLDFSGASGLGFGPLPPHLLGFRAWIIDHEWHWDGAYAPRFQPIGGYDVPVYEVYFPIGDLQAWKGESMHRMFCLELPGDGGYYFFKPADQDARE